MAPLFTTFYCVSECDKRPKVQIGYSDYHVVCLGEEPMPRKYTMHTGQVKGLSWYARRGNVWMANMPLPVPAGSMVADSLVLHGTTGLHKSLPDDINFWVAGVSKSDPLYAAQHINAYESVYLNSPGDLVLVRIVIP